MNVKDIIKEQREFFNTGATIPVKHRISALKKLKESILYYEEEIYDALKHDLNKGRLETYLTEVHMVLSELNLAIRKLRKWAKPKKVNPGLLNFPSKAYIKPDPYGVSLIISPWNYPFQLLFSPLIGAISGGNTALLKPSEYSEATTEVSEKIVQRAFDSNYVHTFIGGSEITRKLLEEKTDYIFFTGSTKVGKLVAKEAANYLTPTTLELGGKSPCIIDKTCNIDRSAKRVVWGKLINGGQTCVAPDYIYIHKDIKDKFVELFIKYARQFYGENPVAADHYCKIINTKHFERLEKLLSQGAIIYGGETDKNSLKIHPTLLENCDEESDILKEEIFGPIFPIKTFTNIEEVTTYIRSKEKPLALYIFSQSKDVIRYILRNTTSGGVCINDTISHLISHELPFGGVAESGNGAYHGEASFKAFTHSKSVLSKGSFDPEIKFHPFSKEHNTIRLFKKLL